MDFSAFIKSEGRFIMDNINNHISSSKLVINTPSAVAKNTFFYMQEAGCLTGNNTADSQRQNLDSYLIVAITNGKGTLTLENETFPLSKGDCFFIDCHKPHSYATSSFSPWNVVWLHFNGGKSKEYYEYFTSHKKNIFKSPAFDDIVSTILEIININDTQNINAEIITSKMIVELLTSILTVQDKFDESDTAINRKLEKIYEFINTNFKENITLDELSSKFYISKFYLTREFKKIYGITVFQHIINTRINFAKKQLRFSDKSIEEIAHLCGFNDQSYFARQFKKVENVTCLAYRKMWRN